LDVSKNFGDLAATGQRKMASGFFARLSLALAARYDGIILGLYLGLDFEPIAQTMKHIPAQGSP
jgi:hypothetical protein